MRPVVVDLKSFVGRDIMIRLVDDETGQTVAAYLKESPWAHINFDHFRFYETRPFFPTEITSSEINTLPPMDPIRHAGLSAADAAKAMTVPEGFTVKLAAGEPDVIRPIAFALDDRGRLWVAEAHTYPMRAPEGQGRDRILIFEDTDGDGQLDNRKVFIEGLNLVSGLEVGFGGVWVGAAPYLCSFPVKDGDDMPAGPPQVLLDGWGYQDTHETLNTFIWGPDGWLYGCHGVFTHSNVGKPGTPDAERTRLNAGDLALPPDQARLRGLRRGHEQPVGPRLQRPRPGFTDRVRHPAPLPHHPGRALPAAGRQALQPVHLRRHQDHRRPRPLRRAPGTARRQQPVGTGRRRPRPRRGDDLPRRRHLAERVPRQSIFMNNIHGSRANTDVLKRKGSGYVATHGPDFLLANDSWSQMLNFRYGPDGGVYVIDWYDKNQCHSSNPELHQKSLGRIFKISHVNDKWVKVDLQKLSSDKLVELQLNRNDWYVRHARRILQERGPDPAVHAALKRILRENPDVTRKLRALWALHVTDGLTEPELLELLGNDSEYVRSWAVYLTVAFKEAVAGGDSPVRAAGEDRDRRRSCACIWRARFNVSPVDQRWDALTALSRTARMPTIRTSR